MEPFRVRLNCIDHYQATPTEFDSSLPYRDGASSANRPKVPVIRIFGSTETGQKVCVHVHGAFPYLYVEYDGPLNADEVNSAIQQLHASIDRALATSYNRNAYDKNAAFVAHVSLVKGVPFYGYHVGYRFYFKIYLLNPLYMTRLADLLVQGAVLNRPLQPYESHLQYVPQWMCDYSLYGCAYMNCGKVKFRAPVPDYLELSDLSHRWHSYSIEQGSISDEAALPKQSHCPLEVDVCIQDILNRTEITERPLHQDFIEFLKPAVSDERLVPSMAGLWQDETRRRKKRLGIIDPESSPFNPEELVSMSADPRNQSDGGWIHEEEFREMVNKMAIEENRRSESKNATFTSFVQKKPFEDEIRTALESVEELYPDRLKDKQIQPYDHGNNGGHDHPKIHVDESKVQSSDADDSLGYLNEYSDNIFGTFDDGEDIEDSTDIPAAEPEFNPDPDEIGAPKDTNAPSESESEYCSFPDGELEIPLAITQEESGPEAEVGPYKKGIKRSIDRPGNDQNNSQLTKKRSIKQSAGIKESSRTIFGASQSAHASHKESRHGEFTRSVRFDTDLVSSTPGLAPSLRSSQPKGDRVLQKLNFPVVKDPTDPMTMLRFSQESGHSKHLSQASQDLEPDSSSTIPAAEPSSLQFDDGTSSQFQGSSSTETPFTSSNHNLASTFHDAFDIPLDRTLFCLQRSCPTAAEIAATLNYHGQPSVIYQKAYYSDEGDVPERQREYAGREFRLQSDSIHYLPDFDPSGRSSAMFGKQIPSSFDRENQEKTDQKLREACSLRTWEFAAVPPSRSEVVSWFNHQRQDECKEEAAKVIQIAPPSKPNVLSQIEGPTQMNDFGFKYSQRKKSTSVDRPTQYMSMMSLEVHVNTRGALAPNPEEDEITSIFWCVQSEGEDLDVNGTIPNSHVGMLLHGDDEGPKGKVTKALTIDLECEPTELDLITRLVDIVRFYDPDVITGYEVHNGSWGYVIERARKKYDYDLCDELSRVKSQAHGRFGKDSDRWGFNHTSSIRVTGRHMINIWRAMRGELNLLQYTMENVVFHLLQRRIPHYSFQDLTAWFQSETPRDLLKVVDYFVSRVQMNLEILDANELIPRTSEQARLLGIDFYSVFSRGSQFKVESLMFRIAKPENFILVSPSKKQVGQQNALECLPLVMEPQSDFYTSPLLVLDFQSLYPSVMIAYNYCYSTFLGRVQHWRGRDKMGFMDYDRQADILGLLKNNINIAPNGMIYAKTEVRKSLLAKMLTEILETRVMVKTGMKADKDDRILQRLLNNRQLALKLIANVTYGYTSASFSGRMPCSEIADSIVQTGRETLEKAIALIHSVERWGAEVVYGDTDSLFVYLKGRSREEAFDIGEEIAKAVTDMNPRPVKLKFEKVYHPCVLLAKKRYVGFKYEDRNQKEPEFDAKGIETVRRDGTPAEQKIEEKALKILFRTADLSQVKSYFQNQCLKIMQGRVSIQDFCFAREVRLGTYSDRGLPPAGALISTKKMLEDPRSEPQYGERVPYVVVTGAPGSRLIDRCVPPESLLHDAQLELDAEYYITKNLIPPLERIFNLVGANVRQWYEEMPKIQRIRRIEGTTSAATGVGLRKTLESYLKSSACVICKTKLDDTDNPICSECMQQSHVSLLNITSRLQQAEKRVLNLHTVCRSCMGVPFGDEVKCDSQDCPVFYSRTRDGANWKSTKAVLGPVAKLLQDMSEKDLEW
ncbi:hypothetical protein ASPZODRAFT_136340 [Penicilliopsis zonata CBS 506.65]|uniref:DNA polymerase n=1 Tax=Penicilliopsis zonata CBS 506.65 TaxID=1073090 RepID=A0A1L9S8H8_9EURO|nr:hypothetical protein ASPZODRAFT_136340 [Penicilliopsis zonata CBS 506.65]OJJ43465.1 hypothetical protein ASPZODRAFT_136340 [Penicilliopsis zonata CBS 506.65]